VENTGNDHVFTCSCSSEDKPDDQWVRDVRDSALCAVLLNTENLLQSAARLEIGGHTDEGVRLYRLMASTCTER
jgi:hypothetical protein